MPDNIPVRTFLPLFYQMISGFPQEDNRKHRQEDKAINLFIQEFRKRMLLLPAIRLSEGSAVPRVLHFESCINIGSNN
jgi:hypothetical protein